MVSNQWKWLFLALCSTSGIACSTQRCQQCPTPSAGSCCKTAAASACKSCKVETPIPIIAIKPCPGGGSKSFVIDMPSCDTCESGKAVVESAKPDAPRPLAPSVTAAKPAETSTSGKPDMSPQSKEHRDSAIGAIRCDRAKDFAWVVGRLEYLHGKKQWRVRYAPYDVDDLYGGVVALQGVDHMSADLKSGSTVRIQGQLVNPDTQKASPEYQVYDIKTLE